MSVRSADDPMVKSASRPVPIGIAWTLAVSLLACLQAPPDIGGTIPVRAEDTRVVVLLREADAVADHDPREAARMIRTTILPMAEQNARDAAGVHARDVRAQRLVDRLARLMADRSDTLVAYAGALERDDVAAELAVVRRQRRLEASMLRLDNALDAAARTPPSRGCSAPEGADGPE